MYVCGCQCHNGRDRMAPKNTSTPTFHQMYVQMYVSLQVCREQRK